MFIYKILQIKSELKKVKSQKHKVDICISLSDRWMEPSEEGVRAFLSSDC